MAAKVTPPRITRLGGYGSPLRGLADVDVSSAVSGDGVTGWPGTWSELMRLGVVYVKRNG